MNKITQTFNYNGSPITFRQGDATMVNATEMAKPFGKRAVDWLRNDQVQEFISALSKVRKCTLADLVQVTKGGSGRGTWFHEDVALEFARWLSPQFAIWCNDRVKELLRYGMTASNEVIEKTLTNPDYLIQLANVIKQEREQRQLAEAKVVELREENETQRDQISLLETDNEFQRETIERQDKALKVALPKAAQFDAYLNSHGVLTATQVAKIFGLSCVAYNQRLRDAGIQYRLNNQWVLKQPYASWSMAETRMHTITHSDGRLETNAYTVWNQRGVVFLQLLHKNDYNVSKSVKEFELLTGKTEE